MVAVMVAVPDISPCTRPVESTEMAVALFDDQVTAPVMSLLSDEFA